MCRGKYYIKKSIKGSREEGSWTQQNKISASFVVQQLFNNIQLHSCTSAKDADENLYIIL